MALREMGYETIIVNSNPETVSTDYDSSDKLFFEPLTLEDVLHICEQEKPDGVIVQFGGQTPLNLANALEAHGVPIIGTSPRAIDLAEDREHFSALLKELAETGGGRNSHQCGGRRRHCRAHRLPGAAAPLLRAGRTRHDHRI